MLKQKRFRRYARSPLSILLGLALAVFAFGYFLGGFIGKWLVSMGRPREGIAVYRVALKIYPWNAAGHNDLGLTLLQYGDTTGAIDQLRRGVELRPDAARFHHHLGFALFKNGDLDDAIQEFQEAIHLDPQHEEYRRDLEIAIVVRGKERRSDTAAPSK